jgi:hypothetical protein
MSSDISDVHRTTFVAGAVNAECCRDMLTAAAAEKYDDEVLIGAFSF